MRARSQTQQVMTHSTAGVRHACEYKDRKLVITGGFSVTSVLFNMSQGDFMEFSHS